MDTQKIKLGFSTGSLHKFCTAKEALRVLKDAGCNAVELGFVKMNRIEEGQLDEISRSDLAGFDHVSFHAPKFNYGNDEGSIEIFRKIAKINAIRKLDLVVFHPDCVQDFGVFKEAMFDVAFENMDNRKQSFQRPDELERVLSLDVAYKLVLDVNHIYSNDPSMELARTFYSRLGSKIAQIHLSGYIEYHDPIYVTRQIDIIKSIQDFSVPIIIESVISPQEISKERNYILEVIADLAK